LLVAHLKRAAGLGGETAGTFSARRRHLEALERARGELAAAAPHLRGALELAAEHLRNAQAALSDLTGEFTSDDLLGEIFSTFCIGK
jgi:tRNA modification GTPase